MGIRGLLSVWAGRDLSRHLAWSLQVGWSSRLPRPGYMVPWDWGLFAVVEWVGPGVRVPAWSESAWGPGVPSWPWTGRDRVWLERRFPLRLLAFVTWRGKERAIWPIRQETYR